MNFYHQFKRFIQKPRKKSEIPASISGIKGISYPTLSYVGLLACLNPIIIPWPVWLGMVVTVFSFLIFGAGQNLHKLTIQSLQFPILHSDSECWADILLINPTSTPRGGIELRVFSDIHFKQKQRSLHNLLPHSQNQYLVPFFCTYPRGKYSHRLGVVVSSRWPFGFFNNLNFLHLPVHEFWVYPKLEMELIDYPSSNSLTSADTAPTVKETALRQPTQFGVREYRHGDSLKDIDWKKSSTSSKKISKTYEEESGSGLVFSWQDVDDLDSELAVTRLATWVHHAHQQGVSFQLILPNWQNSQQNNTLHFHECMKALSEWQK